MYLIHPSSSIYHVLIGSDTFCKMLSTGGIKISTYKQAEQPPKGYRCCKMCQTNATKRKDKKNYNQPESQAMDHWEKSNYYREAVLLKVLRAMKSYGYQPWMKAELAKLNLSL